MKRAALIPFRLEHVEGMCRLKERTLLGSGDRWLRRFPWQYGRSERRDGFGYALVDPNGQLVGAMLLMRQRFWVFGEEISIDVPADLIVDPEYRGHGILLVYEYLNDPTRQLGMTFSASDVTTKIWGSRGGHVPLGSEQHFAAVLRPRSLIRAKLTRGMGVLGWLVAPPAGIVWSLLGRDSWRRAGRDMSVEEVVPRDARLSDLWENARGDHGITAVRDSAAREWRHGGGRSTLLLVSRSDGRPLCWTAHIESPRAPGPAVRRARVLDVFGGLSGPATCAEALGAMLSHLQSDGFDVADFKGLHPMWRQALVTLGCRPVALPSSFAYCSRLMDRATIPAEDWHLTPADGDCGFWDLGDFPPCADATDPE